MWRLLCLSIISSSLGCSDNCGPHGAPVDGLIASSDQVTLTYGHLVAGANNDCPDPMAPSGVISLTIMGAQTDGTGLVTMCIPRPDSLTDHSLAFGTEVKLIDLSGSDAMCTYTIDSTRPEAGTVQSNHMCGNGTNKAGFELIMNGALSLSRTCGGVKDTNAVTLRGSVAVAAM
jgi:hypothetical protein